MMVVRGGLSLSIKLRGHEESLGPKVFVSAKSWLSRESQSYSTYMHSFRDRCQNFVVPSGIPHGQVKTFRSDNRHIYEDMPPSYYSIIRHRVRTQRLTAD